MGRDKGLCSQSQGRMFIIMHLDQVGVKIPQTAMCPGLNVQHHGEFLFPRTIVLNYSSELFLFTNTILLDT